MTERNEESALEDLTKSGPLADEKKVKKSRDKRTLAELQMAKDLEFVMNTQQGRRFVASILKYTNIGQLAFKSTDRETCHALGAQLVGEWLKERLRLDCLEDMRLMEDEETRDERNNG